jgi:tetratricopeptide (TPR) repeat protein
MKDAVESGRVLPDSISKALRRNNSKAYNIIVIIILISLIALAAYLISDILSFRPDATHESTVSPLGSLGGGKNVSAENWQDKGMELLGQGRYNDSIACFDRAISINSSDSGALIGKGRALYGLGRYDEALKCYDQALMLNSSNGEAFYNKGLALLAMNRSNEAEVAFTRAESLGNWQNPMNSSNDTKKVSMMNNNSGTQANSSGKTPKLTPIIVDWASASSNEHSSVDEGYSYTSSPAKPEVAAKFTTNIEKANNAGNMSNNSINVSNNLPPVTANNTTENVSSEIFTNSSILDNASANVEENATALEKAGRSDNSSLSDNLSMNSTANLQNQAEGQSLTPSSTPPKKIRAPKAPKAPRKPLAPRANSKKQEVSRAASETAQPKSVGEIASSSAAQKPKDNQMNAKKQITKTPKTPTKPKPPKAPTPKSSSKAPKTKGA